MTVGVGVLWGGVLKNIALYLLSLICPLDIQVELLSRELVI